MRRNVGQHAENDFVIAVGIDVIGVSRMASSVSSQPTGLVPTRPRPVSKPPASRASRVRMLMLAPIGLRTTPVFSGPEIAAAQTQSNAGGSDCGRGPGHRGWTLPPVAITSGALYGSVSAASSPGGPWRRRQAVRDLSLQARG